MTEKKSPYTFKNGLIDGLPVGIGYLSVSFGFGIMVVNAGMNILTAVLISMTTLTSAGQVAGLKIIASGGSLLVLAFTQLVINSRYALMGLSLTQKLDSSFGTGQRLFYSAFITDEIFGIASLKSDIIGTRYMNGLICMPYIGWTVGTLLGAAAGEILPDSVTAALGIAIYGMFVAIIVPPSIKDKGIMLAVLIAMVISCVLEYVPVFSGISEGLPIIICAVIAAAVAAVLFPVKEDDNEA